MCFFLKFELESSGSESIESRKILAPESTTIFTLALRPTLVLKSEKLFIFTFVYILFEKVVINYMFWLNITTTLNNNFISIQIKCDGKDKRPGILVSFYE